MIDDLPNVKEEKDRLKEKLENERVRKIKLENSKTAMIGDSNFRCINERGVMASVTAVTGGKLGHIATQVGNENLTNVENIVLGAGQNCINDVEEMDKEGWESRTKAELGYFETTVQNLTTSGKKIFLFSVPPVPVTTSSTARKDARKYINTNLASLAERVNTKTKKGSVTYIGENDANYTPATDFSDERHLTPLAMERRINHLEELLPNGQKLRDACLGEHATGKAYRGCYGTYPTGCMFCTKLKHNESTCELKQGKEVETKKRNLSTESQAEGGRGGKQVKTGK